MGALPQPNIDICAGCGRLYPRAVVRLCSKCSMDVEKRFELVRSHLKANPGSSVSDVAEATGLSRGEISRFYSEKRLVEVDPSGTGHAPTSCTCTPGAVRCPYCRHQLALRFEGARTGDRRTLGEIVADSAAEGGRSKRAERAERPREAPDSRPVEDPDGRVRYVRRKRRSGGKGD